MPETPSRNPLLAGLRAGPQPEPCSMVIFGGAGDLGRRKRIQHGAEVTRIVGTGTVACLTTLDSGRVSLRIEGAASTECAVALPGACRASLLSAQLSERSADPAFRDTLEISRDLAKAVLR